MSVAPVCPRCAGTLQAPSLVSSAWVCDRHGEVLPTYPALIPSAPYLHALAHRSQVPVWLPWPLPMGWLFTGVVHAGDERTGVRATAVACSGPAPLGGVGELILVAEEPGTGLGAWFAAHEYADPGPQIAGLPSTCHVEADGRVSALWSLDGAADRAVFVGEAEGLWLWAVLFPADAGYLVADDLTLMDLRGQGSAFDVPCGALSPRLGLP